MTACKFEILDTHETMCRFVCVRCGRTTDWLSQSEEKVHANCSIGRDVPQQCICRYRSKRPVVVVPGERVTCTRTNIPLYQCDLHHELVSKAFYGGLEDAALKHEAREYKGRICANCQMATT